MHLDMNRKKRPAEPDSMWPDHIDPLSGVRKTKCMTLKMSMQGLRINWSVRLMTEIY